MSIAAVQKIGQARDALAAAVATLATNSYDAAARKLARDRLRQAEALIKEARQAMQTVKEKDPEPEPEPEEDDDDQADDNGNGDNDAKEVNHDNQ